MIAYGIAILLEYVKLLPLTGWVFDCEQGYLIPQVFRLLGRKLVQHGRCIGLLSSWSTQGGAKEPAEWSREGYSERRDLWAAEENGIGSDFCSRDQLEPLDFLPYSEWWRLTTVSCIQLCRRGCGWPTTGCELHGFEAAGDHTWWAVRPAMGGG